MRLPSAMLMLSLLLSTACAPRATYLKGSSQAIPVQPGDTVLYPATWSGAWILSDAALADLIEAAEACRP